MLRRMRLAWLLLAMLLLAFGAFMVFDHAQQYQRVGANAEEQLLAHSHGLDVALSQQLRQTSRILRLIAGVSAQTATTSAPAAGSAAGVQDLRRWLSILTGADSLIVLDAGGRVQAAAGKRDPDAHPATSAALKVAFLELGRSPSPDRLVVSPPYRADDGAAAMALAVARVSPNGQFDGAVVAVLSAECCSELMMALRDSPGTFAGISHGDGRAFLFSPPRPDLAAVNMAVPGSLFSRHRELGQAVSVLEGKNMALGTEQIVVQRTVQPGDVGMDRPLRVAVGRDLVEIYAEWWVDARHDLILFLLIGLTAAGALLLLQQRQRQVVILRLQQDAERRLAAERLRLATEAAGLGVWEYDQSSGRMIGNDRFNALFQLDSTLPDTLAADWRSAVLPDDQPIIDAMLHPPVGGSPVGPHVFRIGCGAAETAVIRAHSIAVAPVEGNGDASGEGKAEGSAMVTGDRDRLRTIGVVEDVTAETRDARRLASDEARLKAVFDVLPVGISISDADGHIIDCNAASERLLQISREQHLARDYGDSRWVIRYPDGRLMPSDDYPSVRALKQQQPVYGAEMRVDTPAGERWLSVSAIPYFSDSAGVSGNRPDASSASLLGVVVAYQDIGEAKRNEQNLRKLSRALDQSGAAVIITDVNGVIEYANEMACSAYGFSREELIGETPRLFKSGKTPDQVYRSMWACILAGNIWRGELTNRKRDGGLIHELVSIAPVRDTAGRITHFAALRESLFERMENERLKADLANRLARVERMEVLGAMAGGVAHDFNNILVAILGFSGLGKVLLRAGGDLSKAAAYFEEIELAGQRAHQLVKQLLVFSRGGTTKSSPVVLADAAHDALSLVKSSFPDAVTLSLEVEEGLPPIEIDAAHLIRLFANPLLNARDAMDRPGRVVVVVRRFEVPEGTHCASCHADFSGKYLMISVADEGRGIPHLLQARIFEPFFTTKAVGEGSGMGLAVVHGVAHSYHGHVLVFARPGRGTELQIFLPDPGSDYRPPPDPETSSQ